MVQDPRGEMARRQEAHAAFILHQQMLHQHLHTHQHTHLGMGYPGMVQPYDPYGEWDILFICLKNNEEKV